MYIAIALLPSLMWGWVGVLIPLIGGNIRQQVVGETAGYLLVALLMWPFVPVQYTAVGVAVSFLSGVICAVGVGFQLISFKAVGVSRTMPISTGLQLVGISGAGVLVFGEWTTATSLTLGLIALVVLIIGTAATTVTQTKHELVGKTSMGRGMVLIGVSTLLFIIYPLLVRYFEVDGFSIVLPQAAGVFLGGWACAGLLGRGMGRREELDLSIDQGATFTLRTVKLLVPGLLWGTGIVALMFSNDRVGVATGFSLSQLGVVISTLGGIWILKERKTPKELGFVLFGCALVVAGAFLIGAAKAYDV